MAWKSVSCLISSLQHYLQYLPHTSFRETHPYSCGAASIVEPWLLYIFSDPNCSCCSTNTIWSFLHQWLYIVYKPGLEPEPGLRLWQALNSGFPKPKPGLWARPDTSLWSLSSCSSLSVLMVSFGVGGDDDPNFTHLGGQGWLGLGLHSWVTQQQVWNMEIMSEWLVNMIASAKTAYSFVSICSHLIWLNLSQVTHFHLILINLNLLTQS